MSLATTKNDHGFKKEKLSMRLDAVRMIEKTAKKIQQDLFGVLAFFAVVVTGIGFLMGKDLDPAWHLLTLVLVGLAFYREYKPVIEITGSPMKPEIKTK